MLFLQHIQGLSWQYLIVYTPSRRTDCFDDAFYEDSFAKEMSDKCSRQLYVTEWSSKSCLQGVFHSPVVKVHSLS